MANYTTVLRIRRALGGRDSTEITNETVTSAMERATARIKRALGKAKVDAVDTIGTGDSTPATVREFCTDLAAHYTMLSTHAGALPNDFRTGFEDVIQELDAILDGSMQIPEVGNPIRATSNTSGYHPVFDMGDPNRHELDSDQQDALDNARDTDG